MYLGVLRKEIGSYYWIYGVLAILWAPVRSKLAFFGQNRVKKPHLEHTGPIKWPKHQLSKKTNHNCPMYPEAHLYQRLCQLDHFPRTTYVFLWKFENEN